MKNKLKIINTFTDEKTNLQFGEYRYHIQNNENMVNGKKFKDSRDFKILFEINFPSYEVVMKKINPNNIPNHFFYELEKIIHKDDNKECILNKAYVCIREATKDINGLGLFLLDSEAFVYEELFIE